MGEGEKTQIPGGQRIAGGYTSIATYALLEAGESPQDSRIQKAVKFLEDAKIDLIYAIGLRRG